MRKWRFTAGKLERQASSSPRLTRPITCPGALSPRPARHRASSAPRLRTATATTAPVTDLGLLWPARLRPPVCRSRSDVSPLCAPRRLDRGGRARLDGSSWRTTPVRRATDMGDRGVLVIGGGPNSQRSPAQASTSPLTLGVDPRRANSRGVCILEAGARSRQRLGGRPAPTRRQIRRAPHGSLRARPSLIGARSSGRGSEAEDRRRRVDLRAGTDAEQGLRSHREDRDRGQLGARGASSGGVNLTVRRLGVEAVTCRGHPSHRPLQRATSRTGWTAPRAPDAHGPVSGKPSPGWSARWPSACAALGPLQKPA